jgi:ribulose-5-phosphate 4-epimerase/fuculose-1-phosphate aldolase
VLDPGCTDLEPNRAGYVIHSAIHAHRHDVGCVIHTHTRCGMAVSCMKEGLLPITQTAMRFADIAYHDYESVAIDMDEQQRLVADLGRSNSMILRNHGLLVAAPSVAEGFNAMYWLEMACRAQVDVMACGASINYPSQAIVDKTFHLYQPHVRRPFGLMEWPAMLRYLDRRDASYRT